MCPDEKSVSEDTLCISVFLQKIEKSYRFQTMLSTCKKFSVRWNIVLKQNGSERRAYCDPL
jgi:hypothetical protein